MPFTGLDSKAAKAMRGFVKSFGTKRPRVPLTKGRDVNTSPTWEREYVPPVQTPRVRKARPGRIVGRQA